MTKDIQALHNAFVQGETSSHTGAQIDYCAKLEEWVYAVAKAKQLKKIYNSDLERKLQFTKPLLSIEMIENMWNRRNDDSTFYIFIVPTLLLIVRFFCLLLWNVWLVQISF